MGWFLWFLASLVDAALYAGYMVLVSVVLTVIAYGVAMLATWIMGLFQ
jgi:hypothetical protein